MLKKIHILALIFLFSFNARAEIIDIQKEDRKIGEWQVLCEIDVMMNNTYCKIAAKFFDQTSVISFDPSSKMKNQLLLAIPPVKVGSFVKIRVDKNDLIFSNTVKNSDFGLIPLASDQKALLLEQMKKGEFLFIRFNIRDSEDEITARINLKDFHKSLDYYKSKTQ